MVDVLVGETGHKEREIEKPLKILLAEDDEAIAQMITKYILQGHNIIVVDTRKNALLELEKAEEKQEPFDWVITDLGLKDGQNAGYDITTAIKLKELGHTFVTLLTSSAEIIRGNKKPDDLTRKLKEKGIHHLMGKPLNQKELIGSVERVREFQKQFQSPQA